MATRAGKKTFVRIMLEEKDLMEEVLNVEYGGYFHMIEMEMLVSFIEDLDQTNYKKIKDMLSMIDFKNGNVMHFMEHLAKGYAHASNEQMGL